MNEQRPPWDHEAEAPVGADPGPVRREPIFNIPNVLLVFLAAIWVVHLVRIGLLSYGQNVGLLFYTAFLPVRYTVPQPELAWFWSPVTYSFLHGNFTHLIVNSIWMVAFGAIVARRIGTGRFCLFWIATAVSAVALHLALHWGEAVPVIGASGVVSGLMGAAARFAFPSNGRFRRDKAHFLPRLSVLESLSNRTVIVYVAVWFAINALAAFGFNGAAPGSASIAWEAHIGGFLCGFLGFGLFDRRDWR